MTDKYDPNRDIDTSSIDSLAAQLDAETTLSQRQAEALAHEYFGVPRQKSADELEISVNSRDALLQRAKGKLEEARRLVQIDDALTRDYDKPAYECSECGSTLAGAYARDGSGEAICWDCAPVESKERFSTE
jgi:formylmethanofuran dehydrogenase subunit E